MGKPKIRFKGYEDDWEQRKFGEIVEKYEDLVETPTEGYTRLGIRSHAKGTFHSFVEKGKELETAKMFRVAADKFIVNITFGWEHAVAITDENDAGKLVSHRFPQYSFNAGMVPKFFRYLILDENFKHHLELSSPGGAGRNRVLKLNDMLEYKMNFPSEVEQGKIAAYFDHLDHLITLHQRKCEETKSLKKYMLQKMFPENGKCVPEIRFSGFSDAWEQRKLGEMIKEYKETVDSDCILPVLTSSKTEGVILQEEHFGRKQQHDITGYNILPRNYCTYRNRSDGVDFTFNINKCCDKGIISKFYPVFSGNNSDVFFISLLLNNSDEIVQEIAYTCTGTGQKVLSFLDLQKMKIKVPNFEEQKKIAAYFDHLDHLITLHQHKCDELQKLKKFMLQNMFV
ncbi:restriction endonuclease subunit S [Roseburia sp. TF10-5]|uniref:restriction endonuclease subunit S n=1 Tax=Roseburia sp. TF10-5 TaxID=2293144 RepID=UPI000E522565|nr:restriction endonuclease subunit S [Roseburia sp. TF10-5]RGI11073.1 restriction endonuclease subunit S [Roseburia sp. TF10-5]